MAQDFVFVDSITPRHNLAKWTATTGIIEEVVVDTVITAEEDEAVAIAISLTTLGAHAVLPVVVVPKEEVIDLEEGRNNSTRKLSWFGRLPPLLVGLVSSRTLRNRQFLI